MKHAIAVLVFAFGVAASGQAQKCSEQTIRAAGQKPAMADDMYFFSGALDKPVVGKNELAKTQDLPVFKERKNQTTRAGESDRIVVSPTGDMAYEYGTGSLAFDDGKTGKHESFVIAYLRVWKVVDGQCKVAAVMYQPEGEGGTRGKR